MLLAPEVARCLRESSSFGGDFVEDVGGGGEEEVESCGSLNGISGVFVGGDGESVVDGGVVGVGGVCECFPEGECAGE